MRSGSTTKPSEGMLAAGPYPSGTFCLLKSCDSGADILRRCLLGIVAEFALPYVVEIGIDWGTNLIKCGDTFGEELP